jgi:hypothetical protein
MGCPTGSAAGPPVRQLEAAIVDKGVLSVLALIEHVLLVGPVGTR